MPEPGIVYLIPSVLHEDGYSAIPHYVMDALQDCQVIFAENERTARRFIKQLWRSDPSRTPFVIDDREWFTIHKAEEQILSDFTSRLKEGKTIGIISEAGCPGIADPGQVLIAAAQRMKASVKPLVGPSSILLALMASGMNGQGFQFLGYLPIDQTERARALAEAEAESARKNITQIFIETPYRNNQLFETILRTCKPGTMICIATNLTSPGESIKTLSAAQWKNELPNLHKQPAIFLLHSNGK